MRIVSRYSPPVVRKCDDAGYGYGDGESTWDSGASEARMDWRKWHAGSGERGTVIEEVGRWLVVVGRSQELDFELDDSASEWYAGSSVFAASSLTLCKA